MARSGTVLAAILAETGRKQSWLADKLNLHPSSVSRWVSGTRPLPRRYVQRIAELLGVDPARLLPDVAPERA